VIEESRERAPLAWGPQANPYGWIGKVTTCSQCRGALLFLADNLAQGANSLGPTRGLLFLLNLCALEPTVPHPDGGRVCARHKFADPQHEGGA